MTLKIVRTRRASKLGLDHKTMPICRHPGCKRKVPLPPGSAWNPETVPLACPEHSYIPADQ